jgi:HEAT repeat protein
LVGPDDEAARESAFLDPDPAIRREALRAARDAADPRALAALAEAARQDPEPLLRTEAVRAIAVLPAVPGDTLANLLRDLWAAGDEGLRGDIALAWASGVVWPAGGREALVERVASEHGIGAVEAAAAILRRPGVDAEASQVVAAQMARSIAAGARVTRLAAMAEAPVDRADLVAALKTASEDDDPPIRIAALARLADAGNASARTALEALASPGLPAATQARFALAETGDRRVQAWLEEDLAAKQPEDRLGAAVALSTLGVPARAAPLLADEDAHVRARAACAIVLAARVER